MYAGGLLTQLTASSAEYPERCTTIPMESRELDLREVKWPHPHSHHKWQSHLSIPSTVDQKPRALLTIPQCLFYTEKEMPCVQALRWSWEILSPCCLCLPVLIPLYLGRTWDLLLTNRIDKGDWKMLLGLLYTTLRLLSSTLTLFLAGFHEASCWLFFSSPSSLWRAPCGKETEQASSQEPARTWGPQSICPHICEVGNGSFPS